MAKRRDKIASMLTTLRECGVQAATFTEKGAITSVTFVNAPPPSQVAALADTELEVAQMFEPPRVRALREQLARAVDEHERVQLRQEINRLNREALVYGHAD